MALDLKFIMVHPDDLSDLNQDILGLNLDEFGFDRAAAWIKTMRQEAEARNEILPCLVVLGTPPDETEWSQRQEWEAQVSRLIEAGAVFWDKRTFEEASGAWRTYRKTEMDYLMGGRDLVFNGSSPVGSPLVSPELDEEPAAVDLSLYVNPPFQLADDDFEELLRRTRESITERED